MKTPWEVDGPRPTGVYVKVGGAPRPPVAAILWLAAAREVDSNQEIVSKHVPPAVISHDVIDTVLIELKTCDNKAGVCGAGNRLVHKAPLVPDTGPGGGSV